MKLLSCIFGPSKKSEVILREIEEHRKLLQHAEESIDKFVAALDGETGWFSCGCSEKEITQKECHLGTSHNSTLRHSAS